MRTVVSANFDRARGRPRGVKTGELVRAPGNRSTKQMPGDLIVHVHYTPMFFTIDGFDMTMKVPVSPPKVMLANRLSYPRCMD